MRNSIWIRLRSDLHHALRHLNRRRGRTVAVTAMVSLAVTMTVTTVTVTYDALIRPLPFPNAERLMLVSRVTPDGELAGTALSDLETWRVRSRAVEEFGAFNDFAATLFSGADSMVVPGAYATQNMAGLLGAVPLAGRWFSGEEDRPAGAAVVVLGASLAAQLFGKAPSALGQTIRVQDEICVVVGVMPHSFSFPIDAQFWIPAGRQSEYALSTNLDLTGVARLAPDATVAMAQAETTEVTPHLQPIGPRRDDRIQIFSLRDFLLDARLRDAAVPLLLTSALVFLLAAASMTNVFICHCVRLAPRVQEWGFR